MSDKLGNIKVIVAKNYEEMSTVAAREVKKQMDAKPNSVLGLATGSTPIGTYQQLIALYQDKKIDFSKVTTFNLDEYSPIKKTSDQSYDYFMKEQLFNHVNINFDNINIPNGEATDIEGECKRFEVAIHKAGGVDFQVLGLGLNGPIGFNEPEDHFSATTRYVSLAQSTVEANARFFETIDDVPKNAITMGIQTIMMAKKIMLLVSGEDKADIVKATLEGPITPEVPASVLQLHHDVTVILDEGAASKLS